MAFLLSVNLKLIMMKCGKQIYQKVHFLNGLKNQLHLQIEGKRIKGEKIKGLYLFMTMFSQKYGSGSKSKTAIIADELNKLAASDDFQFPVAFTTSDVRKWLRNPKTKRLLSASPKVHHFPNLPS